LAKPGYSRFRRTSADANLVVYHKDRLEEVLENAVRDNGHFFVYRKQLKSKIGKQRWADGYRKVSIDSYINMIRQIQGFLAFGTGDPETGGHQKISVFGAGGRHITVSTPVWAPLNKAYAESKPESYKFWNKTGALSNLYDVAASAATLNVSAKESFSTTKTKARGTQTRYRIDLEFSKLPFPLYPIIGKAFRSGTHGHSLKIAEYEVGLEGGANDQKRETLARIKFPEVRRPALRAIAGELGVDLRRQLIRYRRPKK
jgi:hypothetical protein